MLSGSAEPSHPEAAFFAAEDLCSWPRAGSVASLMHGSFGRKMCTPSDDGGLLHNQGLQHSECGGNVPGSPAALQTNGTAGSRCHLLTTFLTSNSYSERRKLTRSC